MQEVLLGFWTLSLEIGIVIRRNMKKKTLLTLFGNSKYVRHIYPIVESAYDTFNTTVGTLETWSSDTNPAYFTEQIAGTTTINKEATIVNQGSFSARIDTDASNSQGQFYYIIAATPNKLIKMTGNIRCSEAGKFGIVSYANEPRLKVLATQNVWTDFVTTGITVATNDALYYTRGSSASSSLYYDNLKAYLLSIPSLFATKRYTPTGDVIAKAKLRVPVGLQGGFMVNMGDAASPFTNGVLCTVDRGFDVDSTAAPRVMARLDKFVAGTRTSVISAAVTYVEGAELEVRKSGTSYTLYYNGTPVAAAATIADATVVDNTLHMQYATDSSVTFGGNVV